MDGWMDGTTDEEKMHTEHTAFYVCRWVGLYTDLSDDFVFDAPEPDAVRTSTLRDGLHE